MIAEYLSALTTIATMTMEEKKERLIQIKLKQMVLEATTNGLFELSANDELEAMTILSLMFDPSSADKSVDETLKEIVDLKREIETEAKIRFVGR
jgi:hypothetical protein